jgi:predicted nucleic acid-binding protein
MTASAGIVLDSSCWIAWIDTTDGRWKAVDDAVEAEQERLLVPSVVLFEIDRWLRRNAIASPTRLRIIRRIRREDQAPVDHRIALRAGVLALAHGLATVDALIAATAEVHGCSLATFDGDFAGVPGATVLAA